MNTRKYPRSLEEAFGPYERGPIEEPRRRKDAGEIVALVVSALSLVFLIFMALAKALPGNGA